MAEYNDYSKPTTTRKYITKPVEIEAIQYNGHNIEAVKKFVDSSFVEKTETIEMPTPYKSVHDVNLIPYTVYCIRTLEGDMEISKDDYIIKGLKGEFYPCKPDVFEEKYELII